jgi:hypothetical protein
VVELRIVLHLATLEGRYPDTSVAARALLDWADLAKATVFAIDPSDRISLEVAGVVPGSARFPQVLRFLENQAADVQRAWAAYPTLKGMVVGAAHALYTSAIAAGVTVAMQPDEQAVRLSDEDRTILREMQSQAAADKQVQAASKRLYRTLENDAAITGIGVAPDWGAPPELVVPKAQFPERGGLWRSQTEDVQFRYEREIWDVILLKPALISKPQSWQFSRGGLKFSAQMADANFLMAMRDGLIPLSLQEGVVMRVEVEYESELVGQIWEVKPRTRKVVRVLSPVPLPKPPTEKGRRD